MKSRCFLVLACIALVLPLAGCPDNPEPPEDTQIDEGIFAPRLGEPMQRATTEERERFERGLEVSLRRFDSESGLGPHFNVSFCGACHEQPTPGGAAPRYRDFLLVGTKLSDGSFVELGVNGVLPNFSMLEPLRFSTPPRADQFVNRSAIPFYGVGALALIDEDAILENVDPDDRDGDGISGRANYDRGFVGRFGRKAQTVSLEGFIRGPLFNHLGITSDPLSNELKDQLPVPSASEDFRSSPLTCFHCQAAAPDEPTTDEDGVPDPELVSEDLFDLVSFVMLMGAPQPEPPTERSRRGEATFDEINCTGCHVPALRGPRGMIPAYSDLLLHDMGDDLADGVPMGLATGREFRTQPLWGISATGPYLHDGRADTIDEAIRWHGGEALASRQAYEELDEAAREDMLEFLLSLGGRSQTSEGLIPPGDPLPETGDWGGPAIGADEERFERGRQLFDRDFGPYDGLGPEFNGDSCRACHFDPVIGGSGPIGVNVLRQASDTGESILAPEMSLLHRFTIESDGVSPHARPRANPESNVFEMRQTPALFGLGLIDAIDEDAIRANADPEDLDGDGIRGRVNLLADGRIGRFGWKASLPTLEDFVRDALSNELGLTLVPDDAFLAGVYEDDDSISDPEFSGTPYDDLVFYVANLDRPPAGQPSEAGKALFDGVGCAGCHSPELPGPDGTPIALYSNLLLHDVAPEEYRGVPEGDASHREFRTPPLWGVGSSAPYMHDGRSPTLDAAIRTHFSEADASREAYEALDESDQQILIEFLKSI